jgi:peptide/nickel transport system substrate-binding protein
MYTEGYVEVKYAEGADGKIDRTKIEKLTPAYPATITTKEAAIEYIYNDKIARELNIILNYWATAATLTTEFTAKAKEVILHENVSDDGTLAVESIKGIVSLGHTDAAGTSVTVNGTEYKVASSHNADGTVVNADEYDILRITIDGVDPKAIWNFAITVAPQHYYGEGSKVGVDIANNKFGVEFASFDFMTDIVQSTRNIKLPMGAGAYKVTNGQNSDTPGESEFYANNVVYFKSNQQFNTVGAGIQNAKIEKVRYQVVSSSNAIAALEEGNVHYISPALTTANYEKLENLSSKGMVTLTTNQLGYGYIGVNSAKINDINLRKAIMCAMNTSLALDYYRAGTAEQIFWPMSKVSWAHPKGADATDNGKDYPPLGAWSEDIAVKNIEKYMQAAGVSAGDSALKVKFTIAGSSLQDHPTYKVFRDAAALLNGLGWDVEVVCDTQALTKINTGSLEVWAAAWSSALDPDLYQVYHKDSSATSTLAWGYNYLKTSGTAEEIEILDNLSDLIDQARETNDKEVRSALYKDAMSYILDLAIELPVYQRSVLYSYNSNVISAESMPQKSEMNPFSSPLDRIWEVEFAK